MAKPLQITIKESVKELRSLQRGHCQLISKRIQVLIVIKQHQDTGGISKRDIAAMTGVNHNSVVSWRNMYLSEGIERLLRHGRIGFRTSLITKEEQLILEHKLKDPNNGLQGYRELLDWLNSQREAKIKYTTLYEFCRRNFATKIKVARKSHVKKDAEAVEAFKKTSHPRPLL